MKTVNKALELRLDILRILSERLGYSRAQVILNNIRSEGVQLYEEDFFDEFLKCKEEGLIAIFMIDSQGRTFFEVTRKGRAFLVAHLGPMFDENGVIYDILRFLAIPPYMQAKANILEFVRCGGHNISKDEFETVFESLQSKEFVECALQQLGNDCSGQFQLTQKGKEYLNSLQTKEPLNENPADNKATFETLNIGHIVRDTILICLRQSQPMGRKAIIRKVRPYAMGLKSREIALLISSLADTGFLQCGNQGFSITEKVGKYLKQRIETLTHSERKRDLKAGISLLFAELATMQERINKKGRNNEEK